MNDSRQARALVIVALFLIALKTSSSQQPFFPDDPLEREPETQDASHVRSWEVSDRYDLFDNTIQRPGERVNRRALNVNTIDEVPDGAWFTNRIGTADVSLVDIVRGPDRGTGPAPGQWVVDEGKPAGIQPGFVLRDATGQRYFVKFDPPSNPEMASGAEVISTKILHAFGYHVPENYISRVRREGLVIGRGATVRRNGQRREFTTHDLDAILRKAARSPDGSYRVLASKEIAGRAIGPFRYYGTRPDDPNDIFAHEHHRELRGLRVVAAWINHHDVRSSNSLDTVVDIGGRRLVRHYLLDFGATLGSGSIEAQKRRAGNEYEWETRPTLLTMLTFGFYVRPWLKIDYPVLPAVGRIEAEYFHPEVWKPDYPNPAFVNARPDDTFWAARRVAGFSDEIIRAIVGTAQFSDKRAEEYLAQVLIRRRDKVLGQWLTSINPLVDFALDASGRLTFRNAAVDAGLSKSPSMYDVRCSPFHNGADAAKASNYETTSTEPRVVLPPRLLTNGEFLRAEVSARHPAHGAWSRPVTVYFRRDSQGWKTVGIERMPDSPTAGSNRQRKRTT